ncbi:hypothetical protein ABIA33_001227 [Streptacidiphilus sp. MAP12-16]|uniref:AAA family ATPase n=1 Tax=Streptacidiphilus sp. MAP12-16 TaxID=3156300 RepID=UPI00351449CA
MTEPTVGGRPEDGPTETKAADVAAGSGANLTPQPTREQQCIAHAALIPDGQLRPALVDAWMKAEALDRETVENLTRRELQRRDVKRRADAIENSQNALTLHEFESEVLTPEQVDKLPDPVWLIADLIGQGTLTQIVGAPGSYKSFAALDIAASIGSGIPWHDHATKQGNTGYVVAEGQAGQKYRNRAWVMEHGQMTGIAFYPKRVNIANPAEMAIVTQWAIKRGIVFIVFDTRARCAPGIDENSNTELDIIITVLHDFQTTTGATVLLVHHDGKSGDPSGRGGQAVEGAADTILHMRKKDHRATLSVYKQKDGPEDLEIVFTPEPRGPSICLISEEGWADGLLSAAERRSVEHDAIRDAVRDYIQENPGVTAHEIETNVQGPRSTVRAARDTLVRWNVVEQRRGTGRDQAIHHFITDHSADQTADQMTLGVAP